jgi:FAD/FMN-containing dehydrogenase
MSLDSDALPAGFLDRCATIVGRERVLHAPGDRAPYEVDFWRHIDGVAAAVVRPRTSEEVAALVALAAAAGVAIVPQGGNTGLVGGGIPDHSGRQLVLSLAGLDRIRTVDPRGEWLVAEAGCTLAAVQAAAESAGRLFPLSLGSEGTCQIGGNLSSNAGGVSVIRYGMARELVLGL